MKFTYNTKLDRLRKLLRENAVLGGEFTLASGESSSTYLDTRRVTMTAEGLHLVGHCVTRGAALELLAAGNLSVVAGPALGAAPLVIATALAWDMDAILVRTDTKDHGTGGRLFGCKPSPGTKVAVLEDVLTTGRSVLRACDALVEEGLVPVCVVAMVDRGGLSTVQARYPASALFTMDDLLYV